MMGHFAIVQSQNKDHQQEGEGHDKLVCSMFDWINMLTNSSSVAVVSCCRYYTVVMLVIKKKIERKLRSEFYIYKYRIKVTSTRLASTKH